jgi:hypothetical protein
MTSGMDDPVGKLLLNCDVCLISVHNNFIHFLEALSQEDLVFEFFSPWLLEDQMSIADHFMLLKFFPLLTTILQITD